MAEPKEVRQARASVEARNASYVKRMVEEGRKLELKGAVAETQEQRQGRQDVATAAVRKRQDDASGQGMGA